jgi:hypothetical protein
MEKTDLITTKLPDQLSPHEKIDALNALAWELRYDDIPRAIELSEAARDLANQGELYQKGLLESLRNLGHCHERLNNYFSSLSPRKTPFNEADQDFVRLKAKSGRGVCLL